MWSDLKGQGGWSAAWDLKQRILPVVQSPDGVLRNRKGPCILCPCCPQAFLKPHRPCRGWTQTHQLCFKEHHPLVPSQFQQNSNTGQNTMDSLLRPVSSGHSVGSHFSRLWKNDLSALTAVHCTAEPIKSKVQFDTALPRRSVNEKQGAGHGQHLLFLCVGDWVGCQCVWLKKEGARAGDHCVALLYSSNNVSHRRKKKKKVGAVGI